MLIIATLLEEGAASSSRNQGDDVIEQIIPRGEHAAKEISSNSSYRETTSFGFIGYLKFIWIKFLLNVRFKILNLII